MPAAPAIDQRIVKAELLELLDDPLCKKWGLGKRLGERLKVSDQTAINYLRDLLGADLYKQELTAWRRALVTTDPLAYTPPPFADELERNLERSRAAYRAEVKALLCRLLSEELPKISHRRLVIETLPKKRIQPIVMRYSAFLAIPKTPKTSQDQAKVVVFAREHHSCQKPNGMAWLFLFTPLLSAGAMTAAIWQRSGEAYGAISLTITIIATLMMAVWLGD